MQFVIHGRLPFKIRQKIYPWLANAKISFSVLFGHEPRSRDQVQSLPGHVCTNARQQPSWRERKEVTYHLHFIYFTFLIDLSFELPGLIRCLL